MEWRLKYQATWRNIENPNVEGNDKEPIQQVLENIFQSSNNKANQG